MTTHHQVLIVEDQAALRSALTIMFNRRGCTVTAVENGQAALDLADGRFDLIMLDLGLADLSGLEVCRRLRARADTAQIPIIMVTGRDDPRDVHEGVAAGADDFVIKPFDFAGLMQRVDRLIQ